MIPLPDDVAAYRENLRTRMNLLDDHDAGTLALLGADAPPPLGTYPARDAERRRLSCDVEIAARMLLGALS
jgi:hypothetical protein